MSLATSTADFEQMFELAPISLWLEDYSALTWPCSQPRKSFTSQTILNAGTTDASCDGPSSPFKWSMN